MVLKFSLKLSFTLQDGEPALASFLHANILSHSSLKRSLAFLLGNKIASHTLLSTQLVQLISDAYDSDPVSCAVCPPRRQSCPSSLHVEDWVGCVT